MKKKLTLKTILLVFVLTIPFLTLSVNIKPVHAKTSQTIPNDFYQNLNYNKEYIYNVTQFRGSLEWINLSWGSVYNVSTNLGGQIKVNFTGFYDKDPYDSFNLFESPMPYMDIKFYEKENSLLTLNHTFYNVSNGESSMNLNLGYNLFKSGFLIPINNFSHLRKKAIEQDTGFFAGDIKVEESYNFISFDFRQESGFQKTNLVYEKESGLLISAKTFAGNYSLKMFLLNHSIKKNQEFKYNVNHFGDASMWYDLTFNYIDLWSTNKNGTIIINYTSQYLKPTDFWGDSFSSDLKRAWYGIEIYFQGFFAPISIISFNNITNREVATNLMLGFNDFQPGFFIPQIRNISYLRKIITEQSRGGVNGNVTMKETNLTFYIDFFQVGGGQNTKLIYEKETGLLLYADTGFGDYSLEITIENYTLPEYGNDKENPINDGIFSFNIPIILGILITITLISISKFKYNKKNI